jgi:hypothetical protein
MTIWAPARNKAQGLLVAGLYHQASSVPCEHAGVMAGGLPGADTTSALAQAHIDRARYLMGSIDTVMPAATRPANCWASPKSSPTTCCAPASSGQ